MILNRIPIVPFKDKEFEGLWYDYSGLFIHKGVNLEEVLYFNNENIDEITCEGFKDEEAARFQKLFKDLLYHSLQRRVQS